MTTPPSLEPSSVEVSWRRLVGVPVVEVAYYFPSILQVIGRYFCGFVMTSPFHSVS